MTFWDRLEKTLDDNNMTASELSRSIGVASSVIYSWKLRDSIPRADIAIKTASVLNTTVEYLVNGTINDNIKSASSYLVPVLNQELSAGHGELLPEEDVVEELLSLPLWLRKKYGNNLAALYVHGDSMYPTLNDGDMVVCDSLGWDSGEGVYAVRLNGNGYVKRIQVGNGKIFIMSDNAAYKTIEEPIGSDSFQIIGKVRLVVHAI